MKTIYTTLLATALLVSILAVQTSAAGYAVNSVGGWHAVNVRTDCTADETYSDTQPAIVSVLPTIQSITMRQARLQLLAMGLFGTVDSTIAGMTGDAGMAVKITWQYSSTVERSNPLFQNIKTMLGFTDAQEEIFFTEGSKL